MMQLELNNKLLKGITAIILVFASANSTADEYFQDAVFKELQSIGIDTQILKTKLSEGDFSGAKSLLEEEKDKTQLTDVEEEVANLIARNVMRKVRLSKEDPATEPVSTPEIGDSSDRVEMVVLDEESPRREVAQIRREISRTGPIPGEATRSYSTESSVGVPVAMADLAGSEKLQAKDQANGQVNDVVNQPVKEQGKDYRKELAIDKEALVKIGVRELLPGMTVFRFLKVQVKTWARNNQKRSPDMLR